MEYLDELFRMLAENARSADSRLLQEHLNAVVIYIMSTNPTIRTDDLQHALSQAFPAFVYPGTIADTMRREGREEGREEGVMIGKIQVLQDLYGQPVSPMESLRELSRPELEALLARLQAQRPDR